MSTDPLPDSPLSITKILLRILSLRADGEDPDLRQLCEDDSAILEEVQRQLSCMESLDLLLHSTKVEYDQELEEAVVVVQADAKLPSTIDRYEIKRLLGQGGFGQVWLAHDPDLNRDVAIKIPRPDRRFSEEQLEAFLKDATRAVAVNGHRSIIDVYDVQRRGSYYYIVSRCVLGGSLSKRMREGPMPAPEAIRIVAEIADALHHAHLKGIVHRDVKPANILLDEQNQPYITDFGLAVTEEELASESAGVRGTVAYMSPEQARGESNLVDGRTDIYSLGVVLYELLTGRLPYVAQDSAAYIQQILTREPRPLRAINDKISIELEAVCLKCLEKDPKKRFSTAREFAQTLQTQNGPWGILLVLFLTLFLSLGSVWYFWPDPAAAPSPPPQTASSKPTIRELPWTERDVATWDVLRDGHSVRVVADNHCFLSVGQLQDELILSADLQEKAWNGRFGLFLGYHPTSMAPNGVQCLTFAICKENNRQLRLSCSHWKIQSDSDRNHRADELASTLFPVEGAVPVRLEIHFDRQRIRSVSANGKPLADFVAKLGSYRLPPTAYSGDVGIWCRASSGTASNISRDRKLLFLKSK